MKKLEILISFLVSTGEPNLYGHSTAVDGVHHDSLYRRWFRRNDWILYVSFYRSVLYDISDGLRHVNLKYDMNIRDVCGAVNFDCDAVRFFFTPRTSLMNIILIFRSSEYCSLHFNKQGPSSIGYENLQSAEEFKYQFFWSCILKQCPSSLEFSIWKAYSYGHCFYVQLITFNALINIRPIL